MTTRMYYRDALSIVFIRIYKKNKTHSYLNEYNFIFLKLSKQKTIQESLRESKELEYI